MNDQGNKPEQDRQYMGYTQAQDTASHIYTQKQSQACIISKQCTLVCDKCRDCEIKIEIECIGHSYLLVQQFATCGNFFFTYLELVTLRHSVHLFKIRWCQPNIGFCIQVNCLKAPNLFKQLCQCSVCVPGRVPLGSQDLATIDYFRTIILS